RGVVTGEGPRHHGVAIGQQADRVHALGGIPTCAGRPQPLPARVDPGDEGIRLPDPYDAVAPELSGAGELSPDERAAVREPDDRVGVIRRASPGAERPGPG